MPGEAEVHEPLAVEGAGHRLQNLDAPLAVRHQFVVGRQDTRDLTLHQQRRNLDFGVVENSQREELRGCASGDAAEFRELWSKRVIKKPISIEFPVEILQRVNAIGIVACQ